MKKNEEAKNLLYEKYKYIVDIFLKKYYYVSKSLNIEESELEQEAYLALSDAIHSYQKDKNAKLSTFISICVDRRLQKIIKSHSGEKAKLLNHMYSLDYDYEGVPLQDMIQSEEQDPLYNLTNQENYDELLQKIKSSLSLNELEVFQYIINGFDYQTIALLTNKNTKQIDNTIQRMKHKIRDIIKD